MKLTPELQKIHKGLDEKDLKAFSRLRSDEEKVNYLQTIANLSKIVADDADLFVDAEEIGVEEEGVVLLSAGGAGLRAGQVITGEFLGTMPMWSTEKKANWKSDKIEGRSVWFNSNYRVKLKDGTIVGIFQTPSLSVLKKVPTLATKSAARNALPFDMINGVKTLRNPRVRIEYVGLIEGAERLKAEYNMEITDGDKAHVFKVGFEKGFVFNRYVKGIVNLMKTPKPNFGTEEGEQLSLSEMLISSFEKYSTEDTYLLGSNQAAAQLAQ